jgi:hypothetical protein
MYKENRDRRQEGAPVKLKQYLSGRVLSQKVYRDTSARIISRDRAG